MRCVGLRTAGLRGGYALHGAHSHFGSVVGVMHCMGLAHTSSLSCREKSVVGGGGCLECAVAWAARRKAI